MMGMSVDLTKLFLSLLFGAVVGIEREFNEKRICVLSRAEF